MKDQENPEQILVENIQEYFSSNETSVPPQQIISDMKFILKSLYDFEQKLTPLSPIEELIIDGFTDEQIWQEILMLNRPVVSMVEDAFCSMVAEVDENEDEDSGDEMQEYEKEIEHDFDEDEENFEMEEDEENFLEEEMEEDEENFNEEMEEDEEIQQEDLDEEDINEDFDEDQKDAKIKKENRNSNHEMSMEELSKFIEVQEQTFEDFDFDQDPGSGDDENFFKPDLLEDEEDEEENNQKLSTFEKHQQRMNKVIKELESEAVQEKSWLLKGEVAAKNRPINALLEETLEFNRMTNPVPVITEKETATLEDIIKERITQGIFDDVKRKYDINEQKKEMVELDQEKNTQGLAAVYESSLNKTESKDELKEQIKGLFDKLMFSLDALTNSHFTPKKIKEEIQVISNAPSISVEEIIPFNVSNTSLIAPSEVHAPTVPKGQNELSAKEKKALRVKAKKTLPKKKQNDRQEAMEKLKKLQNVNVIDKKNKGIDYSSSQAVFSLMNSDNSAKSAKNKTTKKSDLSSAKLKL